MIIFSWSGKVSAEWPGVNQVARMSSRSNSVKSLGTPSSPAKMPRWMSLIESSPPYEPSQPPTASMSTPNDAKILLATIPPLPVTVSAPLTGTSPTLRATGRPVTGLSAGEQRHTDISMSSDCYSRTMEKREETRWLSPDESATWLSVWTMTVWLPSRLDAQLRRDAGLSLSEYHSLSQISMAPERTLRMSELAAVTNMTLSHLSRVVSRMEKAGLVRRSPDAVDGRYTLAVLTDSGYDRVVAAAPGHVEAVRSYVFDSLNEDQKEALGDAVGPIVEALEIGRASCRERVDGA